MNLSQSDEAIIDVYLRKYGIPEKMICYNSNNLL